MFVTRIIEVGVFIALALWILFDILIPTFQGKPLFTMFRSSKKNKLSKELQAQHEKFDELELQEEIHHNQEEIDERLQQLEEPEQPVEKVDVSIVSETEKEQN